MKCFRTLRLPNKLYYVTYLIYTYSFGNIKRYGCFVLSSLQIYMISKRAYWLLPIYYSDSLHAYDQYVFSKLSFKRKKKKTPLKCEVLSFRILLFHLCTFLSFSQQRKLITGLVKKSFVIKRYKNINWVISNLWKLSP